MIVWNERLRRALVRSATLHDGMYRKGKGKEPVITHLVSVAMTVASYTDNEDIVVAALLHDSIEDTPYPPEELKEEFGETVASYVLGVTIPGMRDGWEPSSWKRDRHGYIMNLRSAPIESVMISAADKLDNFTSVLRDFRDDVEDFKLQFSGTKEDRVMVYGTIVEVITERLGMGHPLSSRLLDAWHAYRDFVDMTLE